MCYYQMIPPLFVVHLLGIKVASIMNHQLRMIGQWTEVNKMSEEWKITLSQVHVVIRDNGANLVKAMTEVNLPSFVCFVHCLQLVVNDGLLPQRVVRDLLAVYRSIVGHFKHSSVAYDKLARSSKAQIDTGCVHQMEFSVVHGGVDP